jgi:hypothetical protein
VKKEQEREEGRRGKIL